MLCICSGSFLSERMNDMKIYYSSAITDVTYSSKTKVLKIRMKDGVRIAYYDVPKEVYRELLESPSLGAYFNHYIRNRYK